ncbi:MAG TPA: cupin domain-containing protein [Firmicutes bacterium]|nr:cupin domain-containing protein [Candidatus Fermentithermobacillaceae bacterium]
MGDEWLGREIRRLRTARRMSLKQLAEESGLTFGYIGQIERGEVSPSISSLRRIAAALHITLADLFRAERAANSRIVVPEARPRLKTDDERVTQQLLSPPGLWKMQPMWTEVEPGGTSGDRAYTHEGEEFGILLEGELTVWVGDETYVMKGGDSIYFASTVPHRFANNSGRKAVMIWVITPPSW